MMNTILSLSLLAIGALASPAVAFAQATSTIAGVVTDATGAVLPGVTIEARSPVLIEQVKSAVTDSSGAYRIIDLRPGTYSVTFALQGFSTVVRDGIALEADFTAPINIQMRVGEVKETITVSGQSPVVDVQSTQRRDVLSRETIDSLPTARTYQTVMQSLPAVNAQGTVRFDVGGSSTMQQGSGAAYGGQSGDFSLMIDNMSVGTPIGNGDRPGLYINDGGFEESVYVVNGGAAEVQTPGIKANLIPKQGGNLFKGEFLTTFSNTSMQGTNISSDLVARGFVGSNTLYRAYDANPTYGGPILQDRLWFFSSYRRWAYNNILPKVKTADGSSFPDSNVSQSAVLRLTGQINQNNKVTVAMEKTGKEKYWNNLDTGLVAFEAAGWQAVRQHYYTQAKWTSMLTNRMLLEVGESFTRHDLPNQYHPDTAVSSTFPYGAINKTDIILGTTFGAPAPPQLIKWWNYYTLASLTYVTGSHAFKTGFQYHNGSSEVIVSDTNCSCTQRYRNGAPDSVVIYANPLDSTTVLKADMGIYGQDTWHVKRLTVNYGLRWDYYSGYVPAQDMPAGRFVPERHFAAVDNLPVWRDLSPRIGVSYDLFGNAKTAIKVSVGKYAQQEALGFIENYNPALNGSSTGARSTDTRTWTDLNHNDIAETNELGPSTNLTFGVRNPNTPDPNLKRSYQLLYNVALQQELRPGLAFNASYNRRDYRNIRWTENLATTVNDYTLINIADPQGAGQSVPVYNLARNLLGAINNLDLNSTQNSLIYNGVDFGLNARFPGGAIVTGGTSTGRSIAVTCQFSDPNGTTTTPPLRFCDQTQFSIPFLTTFKMSVSYPLPYRFRISAIFQDQPGDEKIVNYSVGKAIVPTLVQPSVSVRLNAPGSQYYDRVRSADISFSRSFTFGRARISPKLDIFNLLNANPVLAENTVIGPALGQPTSVLNPRLVRIGANVVF